MAAEQRVVIVGAGPVGMVVALSLGRAGIPALVVERNEELAEDLRASTFQPPTLDMLAEFGLSERLVEMGLKAARLQYRDRRTGVYAEFDHGVLKADTGYPFRLQCEQYQLTRLVKKQLAGMPHVELRFGVQVHGVTPKGERVRVSAVGPAGEEQFEGAYVIGADGASSAVRQSMGIEFEGFTYPEGFLGVSTPFDFAAHLPGLAPVTYISDPAEWCSLLRVPGVWRVGLPVRPEDGEAEALEDEVLERRLQGLLPQPRTYEIAHRTLFRIHQRVAASYRGGRVLLAGDAAHVNNPLGGMGMNGGIHDAINLSEKLIRIWRGEGEEGLLDRYVRQRRPVAIEHVQANSMRNKRNMEERDPAVRLRNQEEMRRTAEDPQLAYRYLLKTTMIDTVRQAAAVP